MSDLQTQTKIADERMGAFLDLPVVPERRGFGFGSIVVNTTTDLQTLGEAISRAIQDVIQSGGFVMDLQRGPSVSCLPSRSSALSQFYDQAGDEEPSE